MEWSNEPINSSLHRPEEEQNVGSILVPNT